MLTLSAALMTTEDDKSSQWIMDTACTRHVINDRSNFVSFTPNLGSIHMGNSSAFHSFGSGSGKAKMMVNGLKYMVTLHNLLYVPELVYNSILILGAH